jgi:hypothetical protein
MKSASLAIAVASAVLAVSAPDGQAGGHRGGIAVRSSGGGATAPRVHHFSHRSHTRVFIGGSFFFWPGPYYYGPGPYYAPAAVPAEPLMVDPYWYYCEEAATYYPYVKECAGGWQRVLPSAAPLG